MEPTAQALAVAGQSAASQAAGAMDAAGADPAFIVKAFAGGGIFMYCILAFAILTLGLICERAAFLYFRVSSPPADFRQRILEAILRGDWRGAESTAQTYRRSSLARVVAVGLGLRAAGAGEEEVQARMDEALSQELSRLDRRTGFLAMFGNVSTLLGLLGTIIGMIHSFAAVASASPADRAMMLSKGISEAMNCTAFGLVTAIPALVAYACFQNRTDRLVTTLTEKTAEIYHDLIFRGEAGPFGLSQSNSQSKPQVAIEAPHAKGGFAPAPASASHLAGASASMRG